MKNLKNKNLIVIVQIFVLFFLFDASSINAEDTKPKTIADIPNICWPQKQCTDAKGIFVKKDNEGEKCFGYENIVSKGQLGECRMTPKGSTLEVVIPGMAKVVKTETETVNIAQYIKIIYQFTIALAALLAVIMIMIGGVRWMTAMGNQGQLDSAKTMILNSLVGLILALGSYTILYSINPALVQLKMPQVAMIRQEALKISPPPLPIKFCEKPIIKTGAYCISPIKEQNNCIETKCSDFKFICQIRTPESLSGTDNLSKFMKSQGEFIYNSVFDKYYFCSDLILIPFSLKFECDGKDQMNGIDHCWFYIDTEVECGKLKNNWGRDSIGNKCPKKQDKTQNCVIFPVDGWEEEMRLDGYYLKNAQCAF